MSSIAQEHIIDYVVRGRVKSLTTGGESAIQGKVRLSVVATSFTEAKKQGCPEAKIQAEGILSALAQQKGAILLPGTIRVDGCN